MSTHTDPRRAENSSPPDCRRFGARGTAENAEGFRAWPSSPGQNPATMFGTYSKAGELGDPEPCYITASRPQDAYQDIFTLVATPQYYKYGVPSARNELYGYRTYQPLYH